MRKSCVDGCSNAEKAVLLSKEGNNEMWLYRCSILKRIISSDEGVTKLGCGSFCEGIIILEPAEVENKELVSEHVAAAPDVHMQMPIEPESAPAPASAPVAQIIVPSPVKRKPGRPPKVKTPDIPLQMPSELEKKAHGNIIADIIGRPELKENIPAAITAPVQPEQPVKRKRGRPPKAGFARSGFAQGDPIQKLDGGYGFSQGDPIEKLG